MKKCKCTPQCEAVVKSKNKTYARGHAPASHIFTEERCKKISKAAKRSYKNGRINYFKGKHHSKETKKLIAKKTKRWMRKNNKKFREIMKKSEAHHRHVLNNLKLMVKANTGKPRIHSPETCKKISVASKEAYATGIKKPTHYATMQSCYKSGWVTTKKGIPKKMYYACSWEQALIAMMDTSSLVKKFTKEPFGIPYKYKGEKSTYFPDYLIEYKDGRKFIVETKGGQEDRFKVQAKIKAAFRYCKKQHYDYF